MQPKIIFIIISALIASDLSVIAQDTTPKYSNEFLSLGVGSRGFGMSNAQSAIAVDVTAAYWNPAGLVELEGQYQVSLMHSEFFAGIAKYDYLGFAMRIDSLSVFAISAIRFGVDDIPDTRFLYDANGALNYDNVQLFSAADYGFLFSYARKMNFLPGFSLGGNFKVIHRNVGDFASAWGFGLDVGAHYDLKDWRFGLMLRDITGTFTAWSHNTEKVEDIYLQTGNVIPKTTLEITLPRMIIGVGRRFVVKENWGILPAIDLVTTFDGKRNVLVKTNTVSMDPIFGLELDFKKIAFLRFGVGNFQQIEDFDGSKSTDFQPSFGLGVRIKSLDIDYALKDMATDSESMYSHIFSITVRIDK